jgi:hypothetical protein
LDLPDVEAAIRIGVAAQLPATAAVPASINRCTPLAASDPQHPFALALRRFAGEHIADTPVLNSERRPLLAMMLRKRSA